MTDKRAVIARSIRDREYREKTAELLHVLAHSIEAMATALDDGDDILGVLAGRGIADNLPLLPKNVRDVFMENLTDEAAAGARADRLYFEAQEAVA